ncbi:multicopper oxidase domain-containing protein [Empedobacter stercoris]|uniref:multicopper oxidase family protein n=1 Tax=Empedobacter stercoris TaxID=1628248 RepID=UPI0016625645|nr:multicopper oxidase domain-containing protein [Empedobacter stercoris]MCA4777550.1 multicopper oxidase domain-containing protein [Empedobacter stercoris]MCA4809665.1 multicopper oxidase domain-containing protein [Empedobacter stercoris]QNT14696.1 multicopper oxidase domain-containing protein [Empedobacter stercoris]
MRKFIFISIIAFSISVIAQKRVEYDLYVHDTIVNYSGKERKAIAVNGQIPMPTLEFTEGDTAVIRVHNQLKEDTSLHWHGLWLPNKEDGVPMLTQDGIKPGETFTYSFPIIQNGTHWYHSHSGYQEQIGMYGSMVLKKRANDPTFRKGIDDLPVVNVMLSEWTDLNPRNIQRMLHNANDWAGIKKGSTQSYAEAIREGHFGTKIINEWKRMLAMDVSDVFYDKFLINGANESQLKQFKAGDKVRLRISNGGASSYFWLRYAGGKITVVANDGNDVEPLDVDRLIIGVSETYDVVVTIPEEGISYEFQATSEDRTGSASLFLGDGKKQLIEPLPKLKYFEGMKMMNDMMNMDGSMNDMGMKMSLQQMDMNTVMYPEITGESNKKTRKKNKESDHSAHGNSSSNIVTLNYGMLKAPENTELPKDAPVKEMRFELTGNMNRYVWSMDNKVLSEVDKIPVKKGEILRITLYNNSMMRHPMHLHGFDFRVINKNGAYSPLKNVLDIMPMETNVIEFQANTEGDWFFHCHILYHMMAGMNRVFEVGDYQNPYIHDQAKMYKMLQMDSNMKHFMAENDFATNGLDGSFMVQDARWALTSEWGIGYKPEHGYEVETHLGRYFGKIQFLQAFIGFDWNQHRTKRHKVEKNIFGQKTARNKGLFSAGFVYKLPMLIDFQTEIYHTGKVRLQLMRKDIPISKRVRAGFMWNTDKEYMGELSYILNKNMHIRTHYDSDMKFGVGLKLVY